MNINSNISTANLIKIFKFIFNIKEAFLGSLSFMTASKVDRN